MNKRNLVILVILVSLVQLVSAQTAQTDSTKVQAPTGTVVDEVIWVVGDEAILKSDVEAMRTIRRLSCGTASPSPRRNRRA